MNAESLTQVICDHIAQDMIPRAKNPLTKFALGAATAGAGRSVLAEKVRAMTAIFAGSDGEFDEASIRESVMAGFSSSGSIPVLGGLISVDAADAERMFARISQPGAQ